MKFEGGTIQDKTYPFIMFTMWVYITSRGFMDTMGVLAGYGERVTGFNGTAVVFYLAYKDITGNDSNQKIN